jgi:hypothetical protein
MKNFKAAIERFGADAKAGKIVKRERLLEEMIGAATLDFVEFGRAELLRNALNDDDVEVLKWRIVVLSEELFKLRAQ